MDIRISETYEYTPSWNGNNEEDKPFVCVLRHLTESQREAAISEEIVDAGTRTTVNYSSLVRLAVVSIDGLTINGVAIKDGRALVDLVGVVPLIQELGVRIASSFSTAVSSKN